MAARSLPAIETLVSRSGTLHDNLVAKLVRYLTARLQSMGHSDWYSDRQVASFAQDMAAQIREAQGAVAAIHSEAVGQMLEVQGATVKPFTPVLAKDLRGVPEEDVWQRPAKEFRRQQALGLDDHDALVATLERARTIAEDDVSLAARVATRDRVERSAATAYRRVIRPELSASGTCGLCVVAADRIYAVKELQPIHTHCKCRTVPLYKGQDFGARMNADDLKRIYAAAGGSTAAQALSNTRYKVDEHGELGPVLVIKESKWAQGKSATGSAAKRTGKAAHASEVEKTRATLERSVEQYPAYIEELRKAGKEQQALNAETALRKYKARLKRLDAAN